MPQKPVRRRPDNPSQFGTKWLACLVVNYRPQGG
jgi:hypothetical protein